MSCQKETFESLNSNAEPPKQALLSNPISPDAAKEWFTSQYGESQKISPSLNLIQNGDNYYFNETFTITPLWSLAESSTYRKRNPILVVPVRSIAFLDAKEQKYALVVYRDSLNQLQSKLQVYAAITSYKKTHKKEKVKDFSGIMYQVDLDGHVHHLVTAENGRLKKRITLGANRNFGKNELITRGGCFALGPSIWEELACVINVVFHVFFPEDSGIFFHSILPSQPVLGYGENWTGSGGTTTTSGGGNNNNSTGGTGLLDEVDDNFFGNTEFLIEQRYLAWFSYPEYRSMKDNPELFQQVNEFLTTKGFYIDGFSDINVIQIVKTHSILYNSNSIYSAKFRTLHSLAQNELMPASVMFKQIQSDPVTMYLLMNWWYSKTTDERDLFIRGFGHQAGELYDGIGGSIQFYTKWAQQVATGGRYCITGNCNSLPPSLNIESDFIINLLNMYKDIIKSAASGNSYAQGQLMFEAAMFFFPVEELQVTKAFKPNYLLRGTSEGFAGGAALRELGITPTSMNPAAATVFAIESRNFGNGVLYIAKMETLEAQGVKIIEGNVLEHIEKEIPLMMQPLEFPSKSFIKISAERARQILKEMGIELPSYITKDGGQMDQILKGLPEMTKEQVEIFIKKAQQ